MYMFFDYFGIGIGMWWWFVIGYVGNVKIIIEVDMVDCMVLGL